MRPLVGVQSRGLTCRTGLGIPALAPCCLALHPERSRAARNSVVRRFSLARARFCRFSEEFIRNWRARFGCRCGRRFHGQQRRPALDFRHAAISRPMLRVGPRGGGGCPFVRFCRNLARNLASMHICRGRMCGQRIYSRIVRARRALALDTARNHPDGCMSFRFEAGLCFSRWT